MSDARSSSATATTGTADPVRPLPRALRSLTERSAAFRLADRRRRQLPRGAHSGRRLAGPDRGPRPASRAARGRRCDPGHARAPGPALGRSRPAAEHASRRLPGGLGPARGSRADFSMRLFAGPVDRVAAELAQGSRRRTVSPSGLPAVASRCRDEHGLSLPDAGPRCRVHGPSPRSAMCERGPDGR